MAKPKDDLDDILGAESQETRKAAKSARLKALAPTPKKGTEMKKPKEEVKPDKPTRAAKDAKGTPARATKDAKGDTKKAKKPAKEKAAVGEGAFYYDPDEKKQVMAKLAKVKKPITTRDYAEQNDIPAFKVRLAATALRREGLIKLTKNGNSLTVSPK